MPGSFSQQSPYHVADLAAEAAAKYNKNLIEFSGGKGDGVTDNYAAIVAADALGAVLFRHGTYKVSSSHTFANMPVFENGAKLSIDSGVTITINGGMFTGGQQLFSGSGDVRGLKFASPDVFGATADRGADSYANILKTIAAVSDLYAGIWLNSYYTTSGTLTVNRDNFSIFGRGSKVSGFSRSSVSQTGDTLVLADSSGDEYLHNIDLGNFGIDSYGFATVVTSANWAHLRVSNVTRLDADNINVTDGWDGIVIQGGSVQQWSNVKAMTGNNAFTAASMANTCLKFEKYTFADSSIKQPAEIKMVNVGARSNMAHRNHTYSVHITSADGIFLSSVHAGFAATCALRIEATDGSDVGLVETSNFMADGGNTGTKTDRLIDLYADGTNVIHHINLSNTTIRAAADYGFRISSTSPTYVRDVAGDFEITLCDGHNYYATGAGNLQSCVKVNNPSVGSIGGIVTNSDCRGVYMFGYVDNTSGNIATPKSVNGAANVTDYAKVFV